MCLLALFVRVVEDAAVVVGANREEAYARGGEPPQFLDGPVRAVGGVDPVAGGTWLGINAYGLIVAVTNRSKSQSPTRPRSRGLLARDLLGCANASEAGDLAIKALEQGNYAGCNLVCVDRETPLIIHAGDWLRVRPLPPGIHILADRDIDDPVEPRVRHALGWLGGRNYDNADACITALKELCAQTGNGSPPMCRHGKQGGTVSSSILALGPSLAGSVYWHAQGPPDRTPYTDYSHLLQELPAV